MDHHHNNNGKDFPEGAASPSCLTEEKIRNVMRPFSFPAALGPKTDFKGYQRIWRLPLTFVVDRDGTLRKKDWYGDPGIDESMLESTVTPLLSKR